MNGYGKILRVDLTTSSVSQEEITPELARQYLGGGGINDWLLWEHFLKVDPQIDPCSPENVLITGLGPLGATGLGLGSKMKWTFKSPLTGEELYRVGERIYNLEKAFNSRLGLRRADDHLCHRWMHEPVPEEPRKGMKAADYFDQILTDYYQFHGWDPETSLQTRKKLEELELEEVAEVLAREGAVA